MLHVNGCSSLYNRNLRNISDSGPLYKIRSSQGDAHEDWCLLGLGCVFYLCFKGCFSMSNYTSSNRRMSTKWMWTGMGEIRHDLSYHSNIRLEVLRKTRRPVRIASVWQRFKLGTSRIQIKITAGWTDIFYVTPWSPVKFCWRLEGTCCQHLRCRWTQHYPPKSRQTVQHHIPKDSNLHGRELNPVIWCLNLRKQACVLNSKPSNTHNMRPYTHTQFCVPGHTLTPAQFLLHLFANTHTHTLMHWRTHKHALALRAQTYAC